jgi:cadmium resistance protein CadD (predicted permease)
MFDTIVETVEGILDLDGYITEGYNFLLGLSYIEKLVAGLIAAIVTVLGVFELTKKLSKLIIVVVILGGLWVLYNSGTFDSLIG